MKKKTITLVVATLILALLFVWDGISVPHDTGQVEDKTPISYDRLETPNHQKNISVEDKCDEKTLVKKSKERKDDLPVTENESLTCTLTIKCDTILNNIDNLDEQKISIIPENGIIYHSKDVLFFDGESVFNVLLREMKQNKIHFEYEITPVYETAYIRGISNIYEFDCGELSGWIYRVNGQTPSVGCSLYYVNEGDNIEIMYTCEMGKDLG